MGVGVSYGTSPSQCDVPQLLCQRIATVLASCHMPSNLIKPSRVQRDLGFDSALRNLTRLGKLVPNDYFKALGHQPLRVRSICTKTHLL